MMIRMDLGARPSRHVERCRWSRRKVCLLLGLEHLARNAACGAVYPGSCDVDTPALGRGAEHAEVFREGFSAEPSVANVGHLILHARLVLRMADASRVDEEPANLRVLGE